MEIVITATEANRKFSSILRGVREGKTYTITSHGEPVARIEAPKEPSEAEEAERRTAFEDLMRRIRAQPVMHIGHISRDEMHRR